MFVIKRDGTKEKFDKVKIVKAIEGAILEVDGDLEDNSIAQEIADDGSGYIPPQLVCAALGRECSRGRRCRRYSCWCVWSVS